MTLTTDPNDPELGHGVDSKPGPQQKKYLVLSEEERRKGFVRPLRLSYRHVGALGAKYPLLDLTPEQERTQAGYGYVKFEAYPKSELPVTGKYWTQEGLDKVAKGCGAITTMGLAIAESYAASPTMYGATYCTGCMMHLPVSEFVWTEDGERVGS